MAAGVSSCEISHSLLFFFTYKFLASFREVNSWGEYAPFNDKKGTWLHRQVEPKLANVN